MLHDVDAMAAKANKKSEFKKVQFSLLLSVIIALRLLQRFNDLGKCFLVYVGNSSKGSEKVYVLTYDLGIDKEARVFESFA